MQCNALGCNELAVFHLSWVEDRRCIKEEHLCEFHAPDRLTADPPPAAQFKGRRQRRDQAKQFDIDLIVISEINDQQVIYLREVDGDRRIPLLCGIFEATSLDRRIKGFTSPRPLTHDAMAAAIRLLGGEVGDIVVHRLENHTYYAYASIRRLGDVLLLDLRPSDAYNLAVLCECPIFYADEVLEELGWQTKG